MDVSGSELKTYAMDHHGLIASVCREIDIAKKIDARISRRKDPRRIGSAGMATVAMILNGLGFTNRRLYLTPQFFESKPVSELIGENVCAAQFDNHASGKAVDEISEYGSSKLFGEIALENNLMGTIAHLDSTSLSVEGEYNHCTE